ncbi:MAG: transporter [Rhodospirillales bacterium]|jgi:Na+/H+ antiporter NhaD/arsenite permease-like protein|nr:transporter [Rhodospirillales bacterium]
MSSEILFVVAVFAAVYLGMALGRWPGLRIDRTGIAILGAIALVAGGGIEAADATLAVDMPTLLMLFGLMILSAQFAACGFYDWCSARIAASDASPAAILALTVAVAGLLSALLANDIVVFAMTPMLIAGIKGRGLDPRPYLIGLAGGANAGSAATIIGNPQNILIGQAGHLDFWRFLLVAGPPALLGLTIVFVVVWRVWRHRFIADRSAPSVDMPVPDRLGLAKAAVASAVLLALFASPLPHVISILIVAGALLISRRFASRDMLRLVDWHLLVLFAGLFIVTDAFARTGLPEHALAWLAETGWGLGSLPVLLPLSLLGSNVIGNVPTVVLLLAIAPDLSGHALTALAVLSTLAGNLLIVGSLANIIVVERAREVGVTLGFAEHARCGIPMTLLSMAVATLWLLAIQ